MNFASLDLEIQDLVGYSEEQFNSLPEKTKQNYVERLRKNPPKNLIPREFIKSISGEDIVYRLANNAYKLVCLTENFYMKIVRTDLDLSGIYNYVTHFIKLKLSLPVPNIIKYGSVTFQEKDLHFIVTEKINGKSLNKFDEYHIKLIKQIESEFRSITFPTLGILYKDEILPYFNNGSITHWMKALMEHLMKTLSTVACLIPIKDYRILIIFFAYTNTRITKNL